MGLHIFSNEVRVTLSFECYDGSGSSKTPLVLLATDTANLVLTGGATIPLHISDAASGLFEAEVDGTDVPLGSANADVVITHADGRVETCRVFIIIRENPVA